ncbi:MAG: hypothetical protein AAFZ07_13890 [Actinomycetota bacterium]
MPALSRRTERTLIRVVHIVVGSLLATFVYLPMEYDAAHDLLRSTLMFVGVPVVAGSGLWLWKGAAIRRALARSASGSAAS